MVHFSERVITPDVPNEIESLNRPRSITTVTEEMVIKWLDDEGLNVEITDWDSPDGTSSKGLRSDTLEAISIEDITKLFQRIYLDGFKAGHNRWPK